MCVTFDDGFCSVAEFALPVLGEMGIPATVFIVTGNLGRCPQWYMGEGHPDSRQPLMSTEEVRRNAESGILSFGSHTVTHPDLARVGSEELTAELRHSKQAVDTLLKTDTVDLALPFGSRTDSVVDTAVRSGYRRIFTLDPRAVDTPGSTSELGRFLVPNGMSKLEFALVSLGAYGWRSRVRGLIRALTRRLRLAGN